MHGILVPLISGVRTQWRSKLGGWLRLWIVTSALYAAIVAALAWSTLPTPESVHHNAAFYPSVPIAERSRILNSQVKASNEQDFIRDARSVKDAELDQMPNGHTLVFRAGLKPAEVESSVQAYWEVVEHVAAQQRSRHIFIAFLWWLLPVLFVCVIGFGVRWVARGFKQA
jgi:hypothetical protein